MSDEQSLDDLIAAAATLVAECDDDHALANAKARFLGRDGAVTARMKSLGKLAPAERGPAGKAPKPVLPKPVFPSPDASWDLLGMAARARMLASGSGRRVCGGVGRAADLAARGVCGSSSGPSGCASLASQSNAPQQSAAIQSDFPGALVALAGGGVWDWGLAPGCARSR